MSKRLKLDDFVNIKKTGLRMDTSFVKEKMDKSVFKNLIKCQEDLLLKLVMDYIYNE